MTREEICYSLKNIWSPEITGYEYKAINAACEELKSGYWEADEKGNCQCSNCELHYDSWARGFKYCPNCGAKMVEERTLTKEEAYEALTQCIDWAEHTGKRYVDTVPADALQIAVEALVKIGVE